MKRKIKIADLPSPEKLTTWLKQSFPDWSIEPLIFRDTERDYDHGGAYYDLGINRTALKLKLENEILEIIIMPWGLQLFWSGKNGDLIADSLAKAMST